MADAACKVRGSPAASIFTATAGAFVGMTSIALFGPAMHLLKEELRLGPMEAAWLIACPNASGAVLRIALGAYAEAAGAVRPLAALLALAACGVLGAAVAAAALEAGPAAGLDVGPAPGTYSALLALGVLAGCGIATGPVGIVQISYWHPTRAQGTVLGIFGGVICAAPGLWTLALPHLLESAGLGATYVLWGGLLLVVAMAYAVAATDAPYFQLRSAGLGKEAARAAAAADHGEELFPADEAAGSLLAAARSWRTWALVCLYASAFGGMVSLTGWLPTYWREVHGCRPTSAGGLTALHGVCFAISRVAAGPLSDHVGGGATMGSALSVTVVGAMLFVRCRSFAADLAGEVLLAVGSGAASSAVLKLLPQEVPQAVGGAAGIVTGLGSFGGFVLTPCLAAFAHSFGQDGYSQGFAIFAILAIANVGVVLLLRLSSRQLPTNAYALAAHLDIGDDDAAAAGK